MVVLDGELTIYRAAELRDQLLAATAAHPDGFDVDLAGVTEIDSAGVQLLMAAKRAAQSEGGDIALVGHSAAVTEVFELLDLAAHFGDPLLVAP